MAIRKRSHTRPFMFFSQLIKDSLVEEISNEDFDKLMNKLFNDRDIVTQIDVEKFFDTYENRKDLYNATLHAIAPKVFKIIKSK